MNIEGRHPLTILDIYPNGKKITTTHTPLKEVKISVEGGKNKKVRFKIGGSSKAKEETEKGEGDSRPGLGSSMRDIAK